MSTTLTPLACPKCGGEIFRKYFAEIPGFFFVDITGKNPSGTLKVSYEVCEKCGWQSQSLDKEEMRDRLTQTLRGIYDESNCFQKAPYNPNSGGTQT